jgi:hypothetical protein
VSRGRRFDSCRAQRLNTDRRNYAKVIRGITRRAGHNIGFYEPLLTSKAAGDSNAGVRRGLYVAPFDELAEPRTLIALAVEAEEHGWDGFFLWDHILYRPPVRAVADPWVGLSAIAAHTEHLRVGPLVTPLSRRRVHKVARETATLDRLSRGRLILGVGLGSDR